MWRRARDDSLARLAALRRCRSLLALAALARWRLATTKVDEKEFLLQAFIDRAVLVELGPHSITKAVIYLLLAARRSRSSRRS